MITQSLARFQETFNFKRKIITSSIILMLRESLSGEVEGRGDRGHAALFAPSLCDTYLSHLFGLISCLHFEHRFNMELEKSITILTFSTTWNRFAVLYEALHGFYIFIFILSKCIHFAFLYYKFYINSNKWKISWAVSK